MVAPFLNASTAKNTVISVDHAIISPPVVTAPVDIKAKYKRDSRHQSLWVIMLSVTANRLVGAKAKS